MAWTDVAGALQSASATVVEGLLAPHRDEKLYAVALYAAEDGMSVAVAANSEEQYRAHLASEALAGANSPGDEVYYRWATSEWSLERWHSDLFAEANALIRGEDRRDFDRYREALIEAMISALAGVRESFGDRLADVTMFVSVTDSDEAEGIENDSAARLNPKGLADGFLSRFE
ncbi:DUF4303 domain-containing protein [Allosphingosinicella deserti]|uniref:DUF4303 domain-containing protein n=1 Tax=Allosphingosinicella deserti TaxID=2116704 RepID=A0A2P7QFS9_9SPHN|nr:DUF4303 domain-containing protein [Sphingomonas deserti]PSJ36813.1 hypothetical protein C7I55_24170 [Sphingomonas deserti]